MNVSRPASSPASPGPPPGLPPGPPPGPPARPGQPAPPRPPGRPAPPAPPPLISPARVWLDQAGWPARLYERLLEQRVVLAGGQLDDPAATRLCAQLLTLDAEGDDPIRLELHSLDAELPAALTVMGVLDVVGVPVRARAAGQLSGPALGILAACDQRHGYPNAVFALAEPRASSGGTATQIAAHEQRVAVMTDELYLRLAEVTGREVDEIRADSGRGRYLTVDQAIAYGLIQGSVKRRPER
jgi:ATP-dependent Clp protease protease subunit